MINIKYMQLYNIILIYLIIGIFVNYIFKINFSVLSCGIFAWVGKDIKYFRKDLFNILGMYNDNRGGDACGLYYDDSWYKGIGNTAKYEKLIVENDLHNTLKLKKYPVIIGHDRKTSVGHDTIVNAQPVVLLDFNTEEVLLVQAHNGTITNYRELSKKYSIELITGESDSIAIAKLIDTVGWKVLGEYEGSGAFVINKKDEPNVLYAFHGRSKVTENSTTLTDERPLAYLTFPGKGTFISSDINHLKSISVPKKEIIPCEFRHNILYKLEGDSVIEFLEIDRTTIKPMFKSVTYSSGSSNSAHNTFSKHPISYGDDATKRAIRYYKGLFHINDEPAHGTYIVDAWGWPIVESIKFSRDKHFELSFIYGILMKNRVSYEIMLKIINDAKINDVDEFYQQRNWWELKLSDNLKKYSLFPFWRYNEIGNFAGFIKPNHWTNIFKQAGYYFFDGNFKPIFSRLDFRVYTGQINSVDEKSVLYSLNDFILKREVDPLVYDFSETSDKKLEQIKSIVYAEDKNSTEKEASSIILPTNLKIVKKNKDKWNMVDCETCGAWKDNPDLCKKCVEQYNPDEEESIVDRAYKQYEEDLGVTVMVDSFKLILDAIDDAIDTYESLAINLKDDDIENILDDFRNLQTKLTKY